MSGLLKFAGKHVVFEGLHYLPNTRCYFQCTQVAYISVHKVCDRSEIWDFPEGVNHFS